MKITRKITADKAFLKACEELGLNPANLPIVDALPEKDQRSIIAYYKLTIIIRAMNEGWEPDFSDHNQRKYWNYLWMDSAGFVYSATNSAASYTDTVIGSRLCFKDYATARAAIENFQSLYEEYLLIK